MNQNNNGSELITPPSTSSSLSASPLSTSSSLNGGANYSNQHSNMMLGMTMNGVGEQQQHNHTHKSAHKKTSSRPAVSMAKSSPVVVAAAAVAAQKRPPVDDINEDEAGGCGDDADEDEDAGVLVSTANRFEFKSAGVDNNNEQPIDLSFKRVKTELSTSMY